MKRFCLALAVGVLLAGSVMLSGSAGPSAKSRSGTAIDRLQVEQETQNPWTHLQLNNNPAHFKFAIVSDRTGGHRAKVFSLAVEQLNLLQPEFVVSIGDLIEGGAKKTEAQLNEEWKEFQGLVGKLQMPFFYVAGNHDIMTAQGEKVWHKHYGRSYYHFMYRNVLFLMLNSEDPPNSGRLSKEQVAYAKKALQENNDVRWTFVFLHRPLWTSQYNPEGTLWPEVELALEGRPYTVFAGHVHRYQKFVRNGQHYYQLATTGGVSKMRGIRYGEFDHVTLVTMKNDGPILANILLDGIWPDNMVKPDVSEPGHVEDRKPVHPVRGKVYFEGKPLSSGRVVFFPADGKRGKPRPDSFIEEDGSYSLSSYTPNDGAPEDEYIVTIVFYRGKAGEDDALPLTESGRPPKFHDSLPPRYGKPETSDLRVKVRPGVNDLDLRLGR